MSQQHFLEKLYFRNIERTDFLRKKFIQTIFLIALHFLLRFLIEL